MNLAQSITDVRRAIRDIPREGAAVASDQDVYETAAASLSDDDIEQRLVDAARWVAARVRADAVPDLILRVTPDAMEPLEVLRVLGSRVTVNDVEATRRTFRGQRAMDASGRGATPAYPAYVFEDGDIQSFPATDAPLVAVVTAPESVASIPDSLADAVVNRAAGLALVSLGMAGPGMAAAKAAGDALVDFALPRRST